MKLGGLKSLNSRGMPRVFPGLVERVFFQVATRWHNFLRAGTTSVTRLNGPAAALDGSNVNAFASCSEEFSIRRRRSSGCLKEENNFPHPRIRRFPVRVIPDEDAKSGRRSARNN